MAHRLDCETRGPFPPVRNDNFIPDTALGTSSVVEHLLPQYLPLSAVL